VGQRLRQRVAEIGNAYLIDLRWMNGWPLVHLGGIPNHRATVGAEILELSGTLVASRRGRTVCCTSGTTRMRGTPQRVQVFRLVRGAVTEHADPFLSPAIPVLEDDDTGSG
jgi:hypothetical protein